MLSALNDGGARSKTLLTRLADQPKSPAIIGIAEVLCEQGHYNEAILRLRSVAEIYGDTYRFNLVLARACRDAGEIELAKQHYEKACQIAPQNEVAIKELITLTAFPYALPKPSARSSEHIAKRKSASALAEPAPKKQEPQAAEPETPSVFKLDREKLAKVLGGVIGSIEKSETTPVESQKSESSASAVSSPVVEAFRQTDHLLEQEPDIDALAREMMASTFSSEPTLNTAANEQHVSGIDVIDKAKESASTENISSGENRIEKADECQSALPMPTSVSSSQTPEPPPLASPAESSFQNGEARSFEEEIMAMQLQGGDIDAFISSKDTAHRSDSTATMPPPSSQEPDLEALAREMMNAQLPKVEETNDPTPISEQRQPFSDDEEIKTPTRQLAKIFQSQGAYAKAIKVYEMLAEREPENASLYEILITTLREKMTSTK